MDGEPIGADEWVDGLAEFVTRMVKELFQAVG